MEVKEKTRLHLLDALRGFLLLHMIAFHGMWNLVYLFGVKAQWYSGTTKYLWQQFICWSFILLSGFCWNFSRNHLRRGLLVFGGGALVSAVTFVAMPENLVFCGVLTLLLRYFGLFPEGVTYAILLMNLCVWVIDRYTAPRRFGVKKGGAAK